MYQKGDLLWIPAGTLLMRPRIFGEDDLFSNYFQTLEPCIGLFLNFHRDNKCVVLIDGQNWSVETKNVRHNVREKSCVG